jgi:hypothetical protein
MIHDIGKWLSSPVTNRDVLIWTGIAITLLGYHAEKLSDRLKALEAKTEKQKWPKSSE